MKAENVLLFLSGAAASYVLLALGAGSTTPATSLLGDPVPEAHAETTGTRLSAKVTTGSDGSQLFEPEVLHDTKLDVDCRFHKAADDSIRCLPVLESAGYSIGWAFLDDQCQDRVIFVDATGGGCEQWVPKYVFTNTSTPLCGDIEKELGLHVFQVGALVENPGPTYIMTPQGNCVQGGGGAGVPYALSPELPASTFVEGTLGLDP